MTSARCELGGKKVANCVTAKVTVARFSRVRLHKYFSHFKKGEGDNHRHESAGSWDKTGQGVAEHSGYIYIYTTDFF